ncbi:MAG: hypothetical protein JOZ47_03115 [Kutzneria sp.]|nr:hypothetical protein [Kutzneria sp.]
MTETTTAAESADDDLVASRGGSLLRGCSGVVMASLLALLVIVAGAQAYLQVRGYPGVGWTRVCGHALAAALAVVFQWIADRHGRWLSAAASICVLTIAAATLWFYWWA